MLKTILLVNCLLIAINLLAQDKLTIYGSVKDSSGHPVIGAIIRLKTPNNDSLNSISSELGNFHFTNLSHDNFKLSVKSLGFIPWTGFYSPKATDSIIHLPPIILTPNLHILNEVIIKSKRAPVILKQDTIEFSVNQYQLRENAVVEDLIKRLPGLHIEKDGSITFMGQKINKIRINGKDFPVKDIQSLTQFLPADLLDKIQLLDDYGEFAALTGRKTGISEKIINLQTKAELKEASQLKAHAGIGSNSMYTQNILGMHMNNKRQFYIGENSDNINPSATKTDQRKGILTYRGQISSEFSARGNIAGEYTNNQMLSSSAIKTITSAGNILINNTSKTSTENSNYYIIGGSDYKSSNKNFTLTSYVTAHLINQNNISISDNIQQGIQYLKQTLVAVDKAKLPDISGNLIASRHFKNSKLLLTSGINFLYMSNNHYQTINNNTQYFNPDNTPSKDSLLNQSIKKLADISMLAPQLSIIKEIDSSKNIEFQYSLDRNRINSHLITGWQNEAGKYITIDSLSNAYDYITNLHKVGINIKIDKKKINYILGANINYFKYNNKTGFFPSPDLNISYKPSMANNLYFRYVVNAIFPSYQQVQPVKDVSNPLFPIVGNPDIKISVHHMISLEFRHVGKSTLFLALIIRPTINKIVSNIVLVQDSINTFKQETHYLNTSGNYMFNSGYGWSHSLKEGKIQLFFDGSTSLFQNTFFTNNVRQLNKNLIFEHSIKTSFYYNWLENSTSINYTINKNLYNQQPSANSTLQNWNLSLDSKLFIGKSQTITFTINKQINDGYSGSITANPILFNTTLEKSILNKKITFKVQGFNLLNERKNIQQIITANTISETRSTLLGRYILFSVQFDLKKIKNN